MPSQQIAHGYVSTARGASSEHDEPSGPPIIGGMVKSRDDFTASTRSVLALRANHRCSYEGCARITTGPSDDSASQGTVTTGVAAHISAAAPGGPRYDSNMTAEERAGIENGIWLCATHARLIDVDYGAYSVEKLRGMKAAHERHIGKLMRDGPGVAQNFTCDLAAFGPELLFTGSLVEATHTTWRFRIEHFVLGDLVTLTTMCGRWDSPAADSYDQYFLSNELGDGRAIAAPASWERTSAGLVLTVPVRPPAARISGTALLADIKLIDGDISGFETVCGLASLAQKISVVLSAQRGEMRSAPTFGTHAWQLVAALGSSGWIERLIRIEAIRMACIPFDDPILGVSSTPLQCVLSVRSLTLTSMRDSRATCRLELNVESVGRWSGDIWIFVPPNSRSAVAATLADPDAGG